MHVNTKKLAVSGLLMALAVVLIILSGVLDFNTLFFLAAAAFFVGCLLLGFILAPQKLYCITYGMMGVYVLAVEGLWQYLGRHDRLKGRKLIFHIGKFVVFNLMYLPALILFPGLLFDGEISGRMLLVFWLGGQAALFVFDRAYEYFLIRMWGQIREKLFGRG